MQRADRFEATQSAEGRYRLLVESITDYAIYVLDPEGIVQSWNPGAQRFKGYTETEIIGQHFSRFYSDEDRAEGLPQRALETASREGKFESEGWRIRKDGSRFWAHVVVDPIRGPAGEIAGYAKITRDLTERREAEAELRRSEEQFRLLVQSVTDYAIYMLSPEGNVVSWNAGAQRIKGYSPKEIIGQNFSKFYVEEERQQGIPAAALQTAAQEGRFEKEGWRVRKNGAKFLANVVIDPIRADDGTLIGFAKITRDVTERKRSEQELERAREALFQSQKMDAVGQLTGGVAHDFNNLLSAVLGSLELARKRLDDPKILRLLDNAIDGARRGAVLTQRMLAFARRQELNSVALNLADVVRGMMGLLQSSLGPSVMIDTSFPPSLPLINADQNQLELAILNLGVNARDAMPNGGPIVIEAKEVPVLKGFSYTRFVCLSITDKGQGMDEATLARAREPFFTTKGVGKGTGLGLSMAHGMVEQLGGKLVLKSQLGAGTTVELWIPAADGESTAVLAPTPEPKRDQRKLVVLAVDDDALVLFNTSAMLEDLGHEVFEATSGKAALEILRREQSIDLVITDQAMPNMTGLQLAEKVKVERPALPILIATGYAELPSTDQTFPKLGKPFRQQDLAAAIAAIEASVLLGTA